MTMTSTLPGPTREHLDWPFFASEHRDYVEQLDAFAVSGAMAAIDHADVDGACRKLVAALGGAGLLNTVRRRTGWRRLDHRFAQGMPRPGNARLA